VITSLPGNAVVAPSVREVDSMVEAGRKRALDYGKTLPNFLCVEITNRSVDAGKGIWRHRDSIAELLSYHDGQETRSTLEVNGRPSKAQRTDLSTTWPLSVREFGGLLNLLFQATSKAEFQWKEAATLGEGSGTLQVFRYRVSPKNATITLRQGEDQQAVGFHGLIYVDSATNGVRRITLEADDIPHGFAFRAVAMTVEYDYVRISGRDYLLPVRSSVKVERGHKKVELNEISFRDYRRFASRAKIKMIQ
jgi:hypothetical protein